MTTDFFGNVAALNVPGNWKISIQTTDNLQFTVSALFTAIACGDNAASAIPPILLKGTALELNEGFFDAIASPIAETAGLYASMEAYLKELEKARLASKEEQDRKAKERAAQTGRKPEDGEARPTKEEKKKAYDEAMKNIAELSGQMKYADALAILPSADDYPEKKGELEKKEADLRKLKSQYDNALFTLNVE
jgi:PRTRC genetic system protein E